MFNANFVLTNTDESTVEQDGQRFPLIMWNSGDPKARKVGGMAYNGGFFISKEGAPADMSAYGWIDEILILESGKDVEGWWRDSVEFALIMARKRWIIQADNAQKIYSWNDYEKAAKDGNPRSHQQTLVLVKGAEELGPFALSLKGTAMMSLNGQKEFAAHGVITNFKHIVIAAFNNALRESAAKQKGGTFIPAPYRVAWCPAVADKDGKEPRFTKVGRGDKSSMVVLPVIGDIPAKPEAVNLDKFYVGDDIYQKVNAIYRDNLDWVKAWDDLKPGSTDKSVQPDTQLADEDLTKVAESAGL